MPDTTSSCTRPSTTAASATNASAAPLHRIIRTPPCASRDITPEFKRYFLLVRHRVAELAPTGSIPAGTTTQHRSSEAIFAHRAAASHAPSATTMRRRVPGEAGFNRARPGRSRRSVDGTAGLAAQAVSLVQSGVPQRLGEAVFQRAQRDVGEAA